MNGTIKAIETRYKGYRFRSRLEARWAVFFDALGEPWTYEPEGFDMGEAGWYLPDFYLPQWDTYVEIKPITTPGATGMSSEKCWSLSRRLRKTVFLIEGNPFPSEHDIFVFHSLGMFIIGRFITRFHPDNGHQIEIAGGPFRYFVTAYSEPVLHDAFEAARGARFEHGENGAAK